MKLLSNEDVKKLKVGDVFYLRYFAVLHKLHTRLVYEGAVVIAGISEDDICCELKDGRTPGYFVSLMLKGPEGETDWPLDRCQHSGWFEFYSVT